METALWAGGLAAGFTVLFVFIGLFGCCWIKI